MRKLLAILLIATIACTVVEENNELDFSELDDIVLENPLFKKIGEEIGKAFKGVKQGVSKFIKGASKAINSAVQFLKDKGLWDIAVETVKQLGVYAAGTLCTTYGGPLAGTACSTGVEFILDKVLNKK